MADWLAVALVIIAWSIITYYAGWLSGLRRAAIRYKASQRELENWQDGW